eukprot:Nitzschia sp. Nitz4//scaffold71_size96697//21153//23708//NITZ4_004688-RA/size96697-processed-gene-0.3-mRNA-1//1//CDS//3329557226//1316//frame0
MPRFPFGKKDKKKDSSSNEVTATSLPWLPSESDRWLLLEQVMNAAARVYIQHAVQAKMDLESDASLSKDAKAKKREKQQSLYEAHKQRLHKLLGEDLLRTVSTCLLLPTSEATTSSNPNKNVGLPENLFACITLLLCNFILLTAKEDSSKQSSASHGYDARIRNVFRIACVDFMTEYYESTDKDKTLWKQLEQQRERLKLPTYSKGPDTETAEAPLEDAVDEKLNKQLSTMLDDEYKKEKGKEENQVASTNVEEIIAGAPPAVLGSLYRKHANRKFQALEQAVTEKIWEHSKAVTSKKTESNQSSSSVATADKEEDAFSRRNLARAAKIGGIGLVAGTLFAVTGGLAAPGIAAGLAAIGVGGTAVALATSQVALMAIFGVGGAGLSAYKMKRRTDGLSEFIIRHESETEESKDVPDGKPQESVKSAVHVHTTVCISGWLSDMQDYQRPWGVTPNNLDKVELLKRFFTVMDPTELKDVDLMLKPYNGSEKDEILWESFSMGLKNKYGKSPENLLPLEERACRLNAEEFDAVDGIVEGLLPTENNEKLTPMAKAATRSEPVYEAPSWTEGQEESESSLVRVWDYQTEFGGDLYTVQWESQILLGMCQVVHNMAMQLASSATKEVLKTTALATIMTAVAWPSLVMSLAGTIDSDWSLVYIRSDLAGVELALSLLQSDEQRPVNLVGFSFGGRVICACLEELAKHQERWEEEQASSRRSNPLKPSSSSDMEKIKYTREPASIIQDVVIMGTPLFVSKSQLRSCRRMVAGRFVNCYSRKDWVLALMFQYKNANSLYRGVCGTAPIEAVGGVENYDVSEIVSSWHANYVHTVPEILDYVGFDQPTPLDVSQQGMEGY